MRTLDATCGSKMMWFDQNNPDVLFADKRKESHILCDGRTLEIDPDILMDFCNMPFPDNTFHLVVFDPPYLRKLGENAYMAKKYGILNYHWRNDIRDGLKECMRVLKPNGVLIFKWNQSEIRLAPDQGPASTGAIIWAHFRSGRAYDLDDFYEGGGE